MVAGGPRWGMVQAGWALPLLQLPQLLWEGGLAGHQHPPPPRRELCPGACRAGPSPLPCSPSTGCAGSPALPAQACGSGPPVRWGTPHPATHRDLVQEGLRCQVGPAPLSLCGPGAAGFLPSPGRSSSRPQGARSWLVACVDAAGLWPACLGLAGLDTCTDMPRALWPGGWAWGRVRVRWEAVWSRPVPGGSPGSGLGAAGSSSGKTPGLAPTVGLRGPGLVVLSLPSGLAQTRPLAAPQSDLKCPQAAHCLLPGPLGGPAGVGRSPACLGTCDSPGPVEDREGRAPHRRKQPGAGPAWHLADPRRVRARLRRACGKP